MHTAQLMPLPLTVACFSKIQIGFIFLVPAHLGSTGKTAVKWVYVCVMFAILMDFYMLICRWQHSIMFSGIRCMSEVNQCRTQLVLGSINRVPSLLG